MEGDNNGQDVLRKRELPKMHKLKEEYSTMANDLNFVLLWMQRELLASQTLSDLALNNRREEVLEKSSSVVVGIPNNPNASQLFRSKEEQEEEPALRNDVSKERKTSSESETWGQYIPPSKTTSTTLETINNTERTVLSPPVGPKKAVGDDMMDIAQALEELSCDKKRSTNSPMEASVGPKPKKRRRRRHEIARNFKCAINGCTKSYGSEGALKTHVRLKHTDGHDHRKREKESKTAPWANAVTAGLSPVVLPQLPPVFKSLAGESLPMPPRMPPTFQEPPRMLPQQNPLHLQPTNNMEMDFQMPKMIPNNNQLPSFNSLLNNINSF